MTDFFRNIAPGVARLGTGYLSAQRATQEKVRDEEMQRDKDALGMYMDLVKSGQWEPVDPKKGAGEGGVLAIGGMFLQPRAISLQDKARFEEAERDRAEAQKRREYAERERAAKEAELERVHKHAGLTREHELEKLRLAALKKDEEKPTTWTNTETGAEYSLTDSDVTRIMKTDPRQLAPHERAFQQAYIQKKVERAKFGQLSPKPRDELAEDKWIKTRRTDILDALATRDDSGKPTHSESEIVSYINELNSDLLPNTATYVYVPEYSDPWIRKEKMVGQTTEKLPAYRDPMTGVPRQLTVADIRTVMDTSGRSFQDAYERLLKQLQPYLIESTPDVSQVPQPPPMQAPGSYRAPSTPFPAYPRPTMKPLGPPVS